MCRSYWREPFGKSLNDPENCLLFVIYEYSSHFED